MKLFFSAILVFSLATSSSTGYAQSIEAFLINKVDEILIDRYPVEDYRYIINTKWIPEKLKETPFDDWIGLSMDDESPRSYETVTVSYNTRSGIKKTRVQVHIQLEQWVPVANTTLSKGDEIESLNITRQWVDITRFRGLYIINEESLIGKAAGRLVKKGRGFQHMDLIQVPIVKPGDVIDLVYSENGINIVIPCIARQNKAIGEVIKLINKETGRTYMGKLTSKSSALWEKTL